MTGLVDSRTALRDITTQQSVYMQDVRLLPHALRHGEELVLSRWNMQAPKPTVSREQCKVVVAADGTAALVSCGKGPTLWRPAKGPTPWYAVSRSETCTLADGDQISLDCNDPEAAVFTCEVSSTYYGYTCYGILLFSLLLYLLWLYLLSPSWVCSLHV